MPIDSASPRSDRDPALRGIVSLAPLHRDTQQVRDLGMLAKWAEASDIA